MKQRHLIITAKACFIQHFGIYTYTKLYNILTAAHTCAATGVEIQ